MSRTIESVGLGIDLSKNFIRGAARLVTANLTTPFPVALNDMVRTALTTQSEVQTLTVTGTPTGGTLTLTYKGYTTAGIAENAAASDVVSALVLLPTIGTAGVTATGGPLPGTPVVVTFAGQNAGQAQALMTASGAGLTGGTSPAATVARTTAGFGQWDAQAAYTDLGPTKGGITVLRNNSEETFDVDQLLADIMSLPTAWNMSVQANMARNDIDLIQYLWEGGAITVDGSSGERTLALGAPTAYTQKRLGVLFQRQSLDGGTTPGGVRAYCFRIAQKTPQESSIVHNKTGDQATIPYTWNCLADPNIVDPKSRFGSIIDQM